MRLAAYIAACSPPPWRSRGARTSYYVFIMATLALTAIVGIGLNVLLGLTGQVSFGHVGLLRARRLRGRDPDSGEVELLGRAAGRGAAVATLTGALLALPALRVRGPYLAMVTIAFGFIVEHAAVEWRGLTGGQNGLMGHSRRRGIRRARRGPHCHRGRRACHARRTAPPGEQPDSGKAMRAVRDAETAAESIGLDPVRVKTAAFAISALCAGIAGALFAPLSGFVTPSTFAFSQSILFVLVVMIGGAGFVAGPLVGAAIVVLLPEFLAGARRIPPAVLRRPAALRALARAGRPGRTALAPAVSGAERRGLALRETAQIAHGPRRRRLRVEHLGISFGGVRAAHDISFEARPGAGDQPDRPERRGQDHGAQHAERLLSPRRRHDPHRRG